MKLLLGCWVVVATIVSLESASPPRVNIALKKTTFQSSTRALGGASSRGLDGNTNQQWGGNSCTHTNNEQSPWWAVDLGGSYQVIDLTIYNRLDCCSDRLKDFDIIVTSSQPTTQNPPKASDGLCLYYPGQPQGVQTFRCTSGGIAGRYVAIRLRGKNPLTLCEVQINGVKAPNIALKKTTLQSSTRAAGGASSRGVDGNTNQQWRGNSCTHTNTEQSPWWAVDLGGSYDVELLTIYNRLDCCSDRLKDFDVIVTPLKPSSQTPPKASDGLCAYHAGQAKSIETIKCASGSVGQYVVIRLRGKNPLTLCEVEISGVPHLANIALKKTTFQSSTRALGGASSRGVDGNTNQQWSGNSCTHTNNEQNPWWAVDFGEISHVDEVTIYNRLDCCSYRLSNFDIMVTNHNPNDQAPNPADGLCVGVSGQPSNIATFQCASGTEGRYLIIRLRGKNPLTLCEVQVKGKAEITPLENLALKKTTFQSSTRAAGGASSRGVDGNTNQQWRGNSCTHTNTEQSPWWAVDLGQTSDVDEVVIYNRLDCCSDRLKDFFIIVTDNNPSDKDPSPDDGLCITYSGQPYDIDTFKCLPGASGRYVVIRLRGKNPLTLCEVEVKGKKAVKLENVAVKKTTFQSSTRAAGGASSRGVDGNTNNMWNGNSCTHTNNEKSPWWAVDLEQRSVISSVTLYNRKDCCSDRLSNFYVSVWDSAPSNASPPEFGKNVCAYQKGQQPNLVQNYKCSKPMPGRYVTVRLTGTNALTLCEVQVYAEKCG